MIAFIDDHREAYGVEPICSLSARSLAGVHPISTCRSTP